MDFGALIRDEAGKAKSTRSKWDGQLGDKDVTLYSGLLTPADNARVLKKYPDFNTSMNMGGMAMYIAVKAEDEEGRKVFSEAKDLPVLLRLPQNLIGEIFQALFADQVEAINEDDEDTQEDRVGN